MPADDPSPRVQAGPPIARRGDGGWAAAGVLAWRELVRFRRQPARILAAVGTGVLLWLVIGSGLAGSVVLGGDQGYAAYLVPGMMTLVAMFTAIFSAIAVIEDRREGFLQGVLVSPVPRWSIAVGTTVGGASVAFIQAAALLPLAWLAGASLTVAGTLAASIGLALTCIALQAIGFAFAWRCRDTASFHSVMNLVFMPLWLLSDAFFPRTGASSWLAGVIAVNPLSWCAQSVRGPLLHEGWPALPLLGAAAFAAAALGWATLTVARERRLAMTA